LDGNKRTGIISATKFLRDNGYDLEITKRMRKRLEVCYVIFKIKEQA